MLPSDSGTSDGLDCFVSPRAFLRLLLSHVVGLQQRMQQLARNSTPRAPSAAAERTSAACLTLSILSPRKPNIVCDHS